MSVNHYDQASRYLVKQEPVAFLAWLLGLSADRFGFGGWIDARRVRFPGEPDRTCDTVAFLENLATGAEPWAVPVEFQIEPDADMFARMLGYLGTLGLEKRPSETRGDRFRLGAVVVNLTGRGDCSRDMRWPEAGFVTRLGVCERNLAGLDADAVLAEIEAGRTPAIVLPLIPLMQRGGEEGIIQRWTALAAAEPDSRRRDDYAGLALVYAEAGDCHAAWKKSLEGWNVIQSKQVLEWQAQALKLGHEKGLDEGRVQKAKQFLLDVLRRRFTTVPSDIAESISRIQDEPTLDRWTNEAFEATSLDAFRLQAGV